MRDPIYLNGEYLSLDQAKVSVLDRGFLFGDGVYEVIPAYRGHLFRLHDHIQRLNNSLAGIQLTLDYRVEDWRAIFQPLLSADRDQNLYLQITRGYAPKRDHAFPQSVTPTVFAMCSDTQPFAGRMHGISAITVEDNRWQLCDIKAITLLGNLLMRQEAQLHSCSEAIVLRDGYALEGAASNLFAVIDGVLLTPPNSHRILPGITRQVVLELCAANRILFDEREIAEADLRRATEVWVASSIREIVPVVELDRNPVGDGLPGALFKRIDSLFQAYKQSLI
jgi:D-alanine transaminase